jgi:hypothetical protein
VRITAAQVPYCHGSARSRFKEQQTDGWLAPSSDTDPKEEIAPLIHTRALTAIHFPAAAALLFSSKRRSRSGTTNSALPQFKQISTCGKINTWGLSRFSSPVKWMAISAGNFLSLSDLHDLHLTVRPHGGPRRQKEDANARREQTTTDLLNYGWATHTSIHPSFRSVPESLI